MRNQRNKKKKIGCLGMSANPPHFCHLQIAKEILDQRIVDEVWLIPCFKHSFDKKLLPWRHRWNMVKLMKSSLARNYLTGQAAKVRACDIEFKRKGKSYTIDTIRGLKAKFPDFKFYWIVGSDIIKNKEYEKWKDWHDLIDEIEFLVVPRKGFKIRESDLLSNFHLVNIKPIKKISSTEIRKRIKEGQSIKELVMPEIEKYIFKNRLYK